jgi:hypothetical protein
MNLKPDPMPFDAYFADKPIRGEMLMPPSNEKYTGERILRAIPGSEFITSYPPLEQLIDGLVARGRCYSLTGQTGHGKTAVAKLIELCAASGKPFAGREVTRCNVLSLQGENPEDAAMRMLGTAQCQGFTSTDLNRVFVIPETFDLEAKVLEVDAVSEMFGPFGLVVIDTSAAYNMGTDENDNLQARRHATMFRDLCNLPGNPTVLVLCHPTKGATRENLVPRGGGAFLNEVDGNLTCWKDDAGVVTLSWAGKFRGPSFEPIRFELKPWELKGVVDSKGRPVQSVVAVPVGEDRAEQLEAKVLDAENRLLLAMAKKPGASVADLAMAAGMTSGMGTPQKSRVHRLLEVLKGQGLAEKTRAGTWVLTAKGRKEADQLP